MKPTACSESFEHDLESSGSGTGGASNTDEFSEKFQRGGSEGHFNPKIYVAGFGDFTQGFFRMKLMLCRE